MKDTHVFFCRNNKKLVNEWKSVWPLSSNRNKNFVPKQLHASRMIQKNQIKLDVGNEQNNKPTFDMLNESKYKRIYLNLTNVVAQRTTTTTTTKKTLRKEHDISAVVVNRSMRWKCTGQVKAKQSKRRNENYMTQQHKP